MKYMALAILFSSAFAGAMTDSRAPGVDREDSIRVVTQEARTSNPGAPANFTGHAQVEQLFAAHDPSRITGGIVTFQPGARSAWHTHPLGQILIVTAGIGLVQQWGAPVHAMKAGDVVWIPAGVKHWHGAAPSSTVTHMAIQEMVDGKNVDWMEPVTDEQYSASAKAP
jgi:4-carboxymuconolactone decarboxylase